MINKIASTNSVLVLNAIPQYLFSAALIVFLPLLPWNPTSILSATLSDDFRKIANFCKLVVSLFNYSIFPTLPSKSQNGECFVKDSLHFLLTFVSKNDDAFASINNTYLTNKVFQASPWYLCVSLLISLGQVRIQYIHAHSEIWLIEIVWHIPSNLAILAPLLHHSVEEGQVVDQWFEGFVWTFFQCCCWDLDVGSTDVEFETIWRLCHNLEGKELQILSVILKG